MMTYSLALWQIAGLILLTLLVVGILRRLVILIVMARSLRLSKLRQSLTDLTSLNSSSQSYSESGSGKPYFRIDGHDITNGVVVYRRYRDGREEHYPIDEAPPAMEGHLFYTSSVDGQGNSINDENTFGPSGFTPGGVSWDQVPRGERMGNRLTGFRSLMRMKGSR